MKDLILRTSCYDGDLYLDSDMENLSYLFEKSDWYAKKLYGITMSRPKFLEQFMKSEIRSYMEIGHPRYVNQAAIDTLEDYVTLELKGDYTKLPITTKEDDFCYMELFWIGSMYSYLHYRTQVMSEDLLKVLSLQEMRHFYVCGHETSWDTNYEHLKAAFDGYKYVPVKVW